MTRKRAHLLSISRVQFVQNSNDFLNRRERENESNHDFCAKQNEKY